MQWGEKFDFRLGSQSPANKAGELVLLWVRPQEYYILKLDVLRKLSFFRMIIRNSINKSTKEFCVIDYFILIFASAFLGDGTTTGIDLWTHPNASWKFVYIAWITRCRPPHMKTAGCMRLSLMFFSQFWLIIFRTSYDGTSVKFVRHLGGIDNRKPWIVVFSKHLQRLTGPGSSNSWRSGCWMKLVYFVASLCTCSTR